MPKHSRRRRMRYARLGARHHARRHVQVGIGTTLGAITAIAPVVAGEFNLPYEVGAMLKGTSGYNMGDLPNMIASNAVRAAPQIVAGIAIPAIAKLLLGGRNPTVFRGRRFIVKGV